MAADLRDVERRARLAFELGRARGALFIASPLLGIGLGVAWLSGLSVRAIALSVFAHLVAAALWWRGRNHVRAIAPGIAAGVSLLVATFVAHGLGEHACDLNECISHCAPIGIVGGLASGALLVGWATRFPNLRGRTWWIESTVLAGVFGSIGCSCIGFIGGIAGLTALALVATPAAVVLRRPA